MAESSDRAAGLAVLGLIDPGWSGDALERKADEIAQASSARDASGRFWTMRLRVPILLAFLIAFFNQLSGINAILYFAPRIFEMTGLGAKAALLQSVGIGITNLVFTFVGLWLIDRLGRRTLLFIGSLGYIASLGLTAWAFFTAHYAIVPACIFAFIAAHAIGQGAVIWVFISEIFPNRHRAEGQALGSFTHWMFAALLTTFFPRMVVAFAPGHVFLFFCGMMVLQLIWVLTMVPETKGVSLEDDAGHAWDEAAGGRVLARQMTGMVFGVGEILWDLLPSGPQLGGAPANFAFHVAGLGIPADVVSRVGQDARGEAIRTRLSEMRLPGELLQTDSALPTGTVSVRLSPAGVPDYTIHEPAAWDGLAATAEALSAMASAGAVCFGSLAQRSPTRVTQFRSSWPLHPNRSQNLRRQPASALLRPPGCGSVPGPGERAEAQ